MSERFNLVLTPAETERMREYVDQMVRPHGGAGFTFGDGHKGVGLYLFDPEYADDGCVFIGGRLVNSRLS